MIVEQRLPKFINYEDGPGWEPYIANYGCPIDNILYCNILFHIINILNIEIYCNIKIQKMTVKKFFFKILTPIYSNWIFEYIHEVSAKLAETKSRLPQNQPYYQSMVAA